VATSRHEPVLTRLLHWFFRWRNRAALHRLRESGSFAESSLFVDSTQLPAEPTVRAVPTPVAELTHLLDRHRSARRTLHHLHIVEQTLRTAPHSSAFSLVPGAVLKQAIRQLESVSDFQTRKGLKLLHLQMRRRLLEEETRAQAAEAGRSNNWQPETRRPARRAVELPIIQDWIDPTALMPFADTEPFKPRTTPHARPFFRSTSSPIPSQPRGRQ